MQIFYYDKVIEDYEMKSKYKLVITHLENLYKENSTAELICSLIGYSWYYLIECDCLNPSEWQFFLDKFHYYIDLGLDKFIDNNKFCFVAGYTLDLHGFYIDKAYEQKGIVLMNKCIELSKNKYLKLLACYFVDNAKKSRLKKIRLKKEDKHYLFLLFPNNSMIDVYFREIFSIE